VIEHAADRTPFICQSQSVNLFLPADVHKRDLHQIHMLAWKRGMKSLYYCRSLSIQRADNVSEKAVKAGTPIAASLSAIEDIGPIPLPSVAPPSTDYEECLSCQ
jgi:ribonucleoside-diphosphate reductase alpha chain